jgi:hypothetical protein
MKNTHKTHMLFVLSILTSSMLGGCGSKLPARTGFLSDYSKLQAESDTSLRYVKSDALSKYSKFIVDPVRVYIEEGSQGIKGDVKEQDIRDLANYMHAEFIKALSDRYEIAHKPGPGVARIRLALTDIGKSSPILNAIPHTKLSGIGLGGAAVEFEMLDSISKEQIGAAIESRKGERLSLDGLSDYGDAKGVIKEWIKRLRTRLDEAHGY